MTFSQTPSKQKKLQTKLTQNFMTSDYNTNIFYFLFFETCQFFLPSVLLFSLQVFVSK